MDERPGRVVYQRRCHAPGCGAPFFVCRSCFRGQRYCSTPCRERARREQRRAANRRHRHSPEGRLDHRDRMRAWRRRRAAPESVMDQGSAAACVARSIARRRPAAFLTAAGGRVRCVVCGRAAVFIELRMRRE